MLVILVWHHSAMPRVPQAGVFIAKQYKELILIIYRFYLQHIPNFAYPVGFPSV
jgi:hypothetical protein